MSGFDEGSFGNNPFARPFLADFEADRPTEPQHTYNEYQYAYPRPGDMPMEVFWDITAGANIRRGQWLIDHTAWPLDEIQRRLVLQDNELSQLDVSSERSTKGAEAARPAVYGSKAVDVAGNSLAGRPVPEDVMLEE